MTPIPSYLEKKYQNIPFVLLDIPKIDPGPDFLEKWKSFAETHPRDITENELDTSGISWNGVSLVEPPAGHWSMKTIDGWKEFPLLMEQLHEYVPNESIPRIVLISNLKPIAAHHDTNEHFSIYEYRAPVVLRTMLYDENPRSTFWMKNRSEFVQDDYSKNSENIQYVDLTESTNSFVYNNRDFVHGADKIPGYMKVLCCVVVDWEWKGYEKLMDQSIEKYGSNYF